MKAYNSASPQGQRPQTYSLSVQYSYPSCTKLDRCFRLVQDLGLINLVLLPINTVVPSPYTLLSRIPPNTPHVSVLDLKDALFTLPLHPSCQELFPFTWTDHNILSDPQLTWTVLPQGFRDSPHFFG